MDDPEIILNLWYVYDELGFIYSLRGRAYIGYGSDKEKLEFLNTFAKTDYLIAKSFPIPERYSTTIHEDDGVKKYQVININDVKIAIGFEALFEDVYKALNNELPAQTSFSISQMPLRAITPLFMDDNGNIFPKFNKTTNF
ncbi:MAG: hypothetical protein IPM32_00755 [Ignavibacteriae bacterium]|nr:hypothetical protein [Ignavibacteriota bacterium]